MAKMRPSWNDYFTKLAHTVAERGTCDRLKVGCVIVAKDNRVLSMGYNGAPPNAPHCSDEGHLLVNDRCVRTVHAEQNAIIQAARVGIAIEDSRAYVTHQPCRTCYMMLVSCGIHQIYYHHPYANANYDDLMKQTGVYCQQWRTYEDYQNKSSLDNIPESEKKLVQPDVANMQGLWSDPVKQ